MSLFGSGLFGAGLFGTDGGTPIWRHTAMRFRLAPAPSFPTRTTSMRFGLAPAAAAPPTIPVGTTGIPQLIVEIAFSSNPTDTPVWVDVSAYCERINISRGRQRELDTTQAGTLTLDLENRDRRFDPTYTSSPYYPNVIPMRRIRARAVWQSANYPLFTGYIESWGQQWKTWQDAVVPITAADAFKPLNLAQLNQSFPSERSDQRVTEVLNAIGWTVGGAAWTLGVSTLGATTVLGPTGDRVVGAGISTIQASILANTSALTHLQNVATTELGFLFADRGGAVNFYGRGSTINLQSLGTFGELEMPYVNIDLAYDDTQLWNDVRITRQGGVQQTASDLASQQQYYLRTLSYTSTLQADDVSAASLAHALVLKYAQPTQQIIAMTLDGTAQPLVLYGQMLGRELGDHVTVRRRPTTGPMIEQFSIIQGINISYDASVADWSVTWRLSLADSTTYWKLGDTTLGVLGTTTRLFF